MISPLGSLPPSTVLLPGSLAPADAPRSKAAPLADTQPPTGPVTPFGQVLDTMVGFVDAKQDAAQAVSQRVLLGDNASLHQSVIAMQEAAVAFTLMVEVRNKLVESYQELMRLQV